LNYFGEPYDHNCGNCDVCKNPPRQFDGTVAAQKALSAILRTGEKVGMNLLVDILRGSSKREIFDNNYHQIKTYGAGKEYSYNDWLYFLLQLMHLGLLEVAYDEHHRLRVTDEGKKVLFDGKKVPLAMPVPKAQPFERAPRTAEKSKAQILREELFERLVQLRRLVAQKQGVPPYLIFSDATLQLMAEKHPVTDNAMKEISGVGERKLQLYGDAFIGEIRKFIAEKNGDGHQVRGGTQIVTWEMLQNGDSVEDIARKRGLTTTTILAHLATMYEHGEMLDISPWIDPEECDMIQGALHLFEEPYQLRPIMDHFDGRYSFDKIRWAIADARRRTREQA
jgi:ATP-dependent DNA helicase RecQ